MPQTISNVKDDYLSVQSISNLFRFTKEKHCVYKKYSLPMKFLSYKMSCL